MLAAITNNQDVAWALAIVALVGACINLAQTRFQSILGWACAIGFLGLVLFWWP
jgi:hypothetical protein